MKVQELQRKHYADQIKRRLEGVPCPKDEITQARINEVISALAMGCSLQRPRMFRNHKMTADDFRRIAEHITIEQVAVAVNARIKKGDDAQNPMWYILGVLARF